MNRRSLLAALAGSLPGLSLAEALVPDSASTAMLRIAATWRGRRDTDSYCIGMLGFDADARTLSVLWQQPLPGRAHGLTMLPDGSVAVVAVRPGRWLQCYTTTGALSRAIVLDDSAPRHFTGHAIASANGRLLLTGETDPRDDRGYIGVRDAATFGGTGDLAQWWHRAA